MRDALLGTVACILALPALASPPPGARSLTAEA